MDIDNDYDESNDIKSDGDNFTVVAGKRAYSLGE